MRRQITARRLASGAGALVLVVAGLGATGGPSAAASGDVATSHPLKVIQYNLADGAECAPHGPACLAHVEEVIDDAAEAPDVVTLEEICKSDVAALESHLENHGLKLAWTIRFTELTAQHPGCAKGPKGQALATPHPMETPVTRLPLGGNYTGSADGKPIEKMFTMMCSRIQVSAATAVRACVVHLRAQGTPQRAAQVKKIVSLTAGYRTHSAPVVVAGDFNVNDRDPDGHQYVAPMRAVFKEADYADQEATHGEAKLDYIWFSRPHLDLSSVTGQVGTAGTSDHRLVVGHASYTY